MADEIWIELVAGSCGATGTIVKMSNTDWRTNPDLLADGAVEKLKLRANNKNKQGVQVAIVHPGGQGKATLRLYALRKGGTFASSKPTSGGPSPTQRLIGRIVVDNGDIQFKQLLDRKTQSPTRFRESLPPRRRGTGSSAYTTNDHGPKDHKDSRRFKVAKTDRSLGNTSGRRGMANKKGLIFIHGDHHVTFSPGCDS